MTTRSLVGIPASLLLGGIANAESTGEGPAGAVALELARQNRLWTALAAAEWTSRYLSEGRENWGNSGMIAGVVGVGHGPLGIELWQGFADSSADREFQGSLAWSHEVGEVSVALRGSWISDTRGESGWEFGVGAEGESWHEVTWRAEIYFAPQPNGAYLECGLSRELMHLGGWTVGVGADGGVNMGYIRDGHRGMDHIGVRLDGETKITEDVVIQMSIARYQAIGRNVRSHPGDDPLYNGWFLRAGAKWEY